MKTAISQREKTPLILVVGLLILAALPFVLPSFYVFLVTRILFLSLASMSFILLAGYGGMLSLAQVTFFGVAGYAVGDTSLKLHLPLWLVIPIALAAAVIVSAAFAFIAVRTQGIYFLMMTLALGQLFYQGTYQWIPLTNGYNGLTGIQVPDAFGGLLTGNNLLYFMTVIPVGLCYLVLRRLVKTRFGLVLQGIRDHPVRMAALGYDVTFHRFLAIVFSGLFAGVAGILAAYFYGVITPDVVSLSAATMVLFVALIGGTSRFEGALVGAIFYVLLQDFASRLTTRYQFVIGGSFMLIVLFLSNGITSIKWDKIRGIAGLLQRLRAASPRPSGE